MLAPAGPQGNLEEVLSNFLGMDIIQGFAAFGADQNTEPPDTQIAAGPTSVVETVNSNMSMWSKTGTRLQILDLNAFYAVPVNYAITDARVLYDPISRHYITSAVAIDGNPSDPNVYSSIIELAASLTTDPTGNWSRFSLKRTTKIVMDQPKVGTSDDKITLSWAEYRAPGCDQSQPTFFCFNGQFTWILDKASIVGGQPSPLYMGAADFARFGIVPVESLSPTTTQYMVYNNADPEFLVENQCAQTNPPQQYGNCPTLGEISVTGSVIANTIHFNEVDPPMKATTPPPDAPQVGSSTLIRTDDDRVLSAVWDNNRIWASETDGNNCAGNFNPPPANETASCLHLIQTATDAPGMPLLQDANIGQNNDYWYYPAVSVDNAGDVYVAFSRSNMSLNPGAWFTGNHGTGWDPFVVLKDANGPYDTMTATCHGQNRFGDYSGAAMDPADPQDVWVAAEYAFNYQGTNTCTWGTAIGRLTYAMPTVTSVTPNMGPAAGGTAVTIKGTDFVTSNTTVFFGATPSSGMVGVLDPDTLTATSPPGTFWVALSAATPEGHGPPGALFKYPRPDANSTSVSQHGGAVAAGPTPPPVTQSAPRTRATPPPPPQTREPGGTPATTARTSTIPMTPTPSWFSIVIAVLRFAGFLLP